MSIDHLRDLVADELNVNAVQFAEREQELVTYKLRPNLATVSKKIQELVPEPPNSAAQGPEAKAEKKALREKRQRLTNGAQTALANLDPGRVASDVRAGRNLILSVDGMQLELTPEDVLVQPQPRSGFAVASDGNLVVALDTELTPELVEEGLDPEFDLLPAGSDEFHPRQYKGGQLIGDNLDEVITFCMENGRATGFEIYGMAENNVLARGMLVRR